MFTYMPTFYANKLKRRNICAVTNNVSMLMATFESSYEYEKRRKL